MQLTAVMDKSPKSDLTLLNDYYMIFNVRRRCRDSIVKCEKSCDSDSLDSKELEGTKACRSFINMLQITDRSRLIAGKCNGRLCEIARN